MSGGIARYLERRAVRGPWTLSGGSRDTIRCAVIIPALAESAWLFDTLGDLAANDAAALDATLVVAVVNHRADASATDQADNAATLKRLADFQQLTPWLAIVDAASPGLELPPGEGVGLARRIGLDAALRFMYDHGADTGALVCLDADTRVPPEYLTQIQQFFEEKQRWAATIAYAHPLDGPEASAIAEYEIYLRHHELGLRYAGSPYAFPTIGSTIACAAEAYAAIGGMPRRQAGEDFYFLQQLAKTGRIERLDTVTVHPSARASHRVPFGTGARIAAHLERDAAPRGLYCTQTFEVLRQWLAWVNAQDMAEAEAFLTAASDFSPVLADFLTANRFTEEWRRITRQARTRERRLAAFHTWFDALRTLRCLHALREAGFQEQSWVEGVAELFEMLAVSPNAPLEDTLAAKCAIVEQLRGLCGEKNGSNGNDGKYGSNGRRQ